MFLHMTPDDCLRDCQANGLPWLVLLRLGNEPAEPRLALRAPEAADCGRIDKDHWFSAISDKSRIAGSMEPVRRSAALIGSVATPVARMPRYWHQQPGVAGKARQVKAGSHRSVEAPRSSPQHSQG